MPFCAIKHLSPLQSWNHFSRSMNGKVDIDSIEAIAFDPYTHGYYKVSERVGEAFKDGFKLKKSGN